MKDTRVLIVYNSRHGQTAHIAKRIRDVASTVDGVIATATPVDDVRENDIAVTDAFVVAGPIRFGRHDRKIQRFIGEHLGVMASRSSAFVSVSNAMARFNGRPEAEGYARKFLDTTGWNPDRVELVAGALRYTRYNLILRWLLRRIADQHGLDTDTSRDFEYTDWEAVDQFARQFVKPKRTWPA